MKVFEQEFEKFLKHLSTTVKKSNQDDGGLEQLYKTWPDFLEYLQAKNRNTTTVDLYSILSQTRMVDFKKESKKLILGSSDSSVRFLIEMNQAKILEYLNSYYDKTEIKKISITQNYV